MSRITAFQQDQPAVFSEPRISHKKTTSLLVDRNPEFLKGKTVFQAFGEHQYDVQGNINNCKHLQVGEYFLKVSSGAHHTFLLTNYGNVLSFGRNGDGQLGNGSIESTFRKDILPVFPKYANEGESVVDVQCGSNHTVILTNFSNCLGCGWNEFFQQGQKRHGVQVSKFGYLDIGKPVIMVRCANNMTIVLTKEMEIYGSGRVAATITYEDFTLLQDFSELLSDEEVITDIQCGSQHIIVSSSFNRIFAFGSNGFTQMGKNVKDMDKFTEITKNLPFPRDEFKSFATGLLFTIFLTKGGGVYACGYNGYGQLGTGTRTDPEDFVRVKNFYKIKSQSQSVLSKFEKRKESEYTCYKASLNSEIGNNVYYIDGNEIIKSIHAGSSHTIFVSNIGNVYTCGFNKFGQLSLPTDGDDYAATYSATQVVLSSHLIDVQVFANPSANITILADRQPINSYMSNNLKKRAREGDLSDIILKHKL
ncbi:predicted protein [Naegleria gruberi]|uniref:Predicted protein n=1 Tax=Naegleria gruberi TaxID=5762 RepID=D2VG43_NAEGR|nr:uncharacterized protein NAEGRDRAFT_67846 [Naegleria gruberi]EFC44204.1 predicted protein [Naegleria gruberi]|eukprot:XP_002676948.1 predicted protein [Naegleria gruberi strain NEG-M]